MYLDRHILIDKYIYIYIYIYIYPKRKARLKDLIDYNNNVEKNLFRKTNKLIKQHALLFRKIKVAHVL